MRLRRNSRIPEFQRKTTQIETLNQDWTKRDSLRNATSSARGSWDVRCWRVALEVPGARRSHVASPFARRQRDIFVFLSGSVLPQRHCRFELVLWLVFFESRQSDQLDQPQYFLSSWTRHLDLLGRPHSRHEFWRLEGFSLFQSKSPHLSGCRFLG